MKKRFFLLLILVFLFTGSQSCIYLKRGITSPTSYTQATHYKKKGGRYVITRRKEMKLSKCQRKSRRLKRIRRESGPNGNNYGINL